MGTKVNANRIDIEKLREKRKKVEQGFHTAKKIIGGVGLGATVILAVIPFDGLVGEFLSALATGGLLLTAELVEMIVLGIMRLTDKKEPLPTMEEAKNVGLKGKQSLEFLKSLVNILKKMPKKGTKNATYTYPTDPGMQLVKA